MRFIGLTGNIGSGKSTVSNYFKKLDFVIIDADLLSREALKQKNIVQQLTSAFGHKILSQDKTINRINLSKIAFSSKKNITKLNCIIHPKIKNLQLKKIQDVYKEKPLATIIYDAALLIEVKSYQFFQKNILVKVSKEIQFSRLMTNRNMTVSQIQERINHQIPQEEKKQCVDFIINNNGLLEDTYAQVKNIVKKIEQLPQLRINQFQQNFT